MIYYGIIFTIITGLCFTTSKMMLEEKVKVRFIALTSVLSFTMSVLLLRVVLQKSVFIIRTIPMILLYSVGIIAAAQIIIVATLLLKRNMQSQPKVKGNVWASVLSVFFKTIMLFCFGFGAFLWLWSNWFIDFFGELTPEQFLFNLNSPLKGTSSDMMNLMLHTPLLYVGTLSVLFAFLLFKPFPNWKRKLNNVKTIVLSLVAISMLLFGVNYSIQTLRLIEVYKAYTESSKYIEQNYIDPAKVNLQFPEKKRNLIHIYAESMESSFFSKDLGGHGDENLMPNLYELSKSGVHFSDTDKMGGSHQTYGSSWSVAGMVNMESGVPLKIPMEGNSYGGAGDFLPGITNLGDILHQQGYNQTIMFGADADFGGLSVYFKQHGKYHIFDVKEAKRQKLISEDYNVWWGFEDDKLFDYAKNEVTRLYNEGKPFHFNMETADTHFPDGYVSKHLKRSRASQYADVIAYSDEQIGQFVKWIQAQPFYENTTIVITGDHLSMDTNYFKDFDKSYKRSPFNLYLNARARQISGKTSNRQFAPLDMFPTMVSALGVEIPGNRLGLGTDLFSGEKTIIETDGLEKFNDELGKRSDFYDSNFISSAKRKE